VNLYPLAESKVLEVELKEGQLKCENAEKISGVYCQV